MSLFVYLISASGSPLVKIGVTKDPEARLKNLAIGSPVPLRLLWTSPGDRALEAALHRQFFDRQSHGEWFDLGDDPVREVQAQIAGLARRGLPRRPGTTSPRQAPPPSVVYRLRDPRNSQVRYIGSTSYPERAANRGTHKNPAVRAWLEELFEAGVKAKVEVIGGDDGTFTYVHDHLLAGEPLIGCADPAVYQQQHEQRQAPVPDQPRPAGSHVWRPSHVYLLRDPRTNRVRLVGETTRPERASSRWAHSNPAVRAWLTELRDAGLQPSVELVSGSKWQNIERQTQAGEPLISYGDTHTLPIVGGKRQRRVSRKDDTHRQPAITEPHPSDEGAK
ncbi:GIY-YIG nuclease family protein [Streptacidiphilus neutrinimicus]|uniref:GIY-YIG nuclease family protein n=1 Tax=Streptacidiphilus neutrinimicus TaxID=105420 RepID=UPI000A04CE59|nr:GIY-YIG nuclease family protein [Streptacidiphilus neutrinimicus]